jgi:hypothetical protein
MGVWLGTDTDLARMEIACAVEGWFDVVVTDADLLGWRTVGDVHQSILARSTTAGDVSGAWARLQWLLSEGFGIELDLVTAEAELFGHPLRLDERGMMRWPLPASEGRMGRAEPGAAADGGGM